MHTETHTVKGKNMSLRIFFAFIRMTAYIAIPAGLSPIIAREIASKTSVDITIIRPWIIIAAFIITWTALLIDYRYIMKPSRTERLKDTTDNI